MPVDLASGSAGHPSPGAVVHAYALATSLTTPVYSPRPPRTTRRTLISTFECTSTTYVAALNVSHLPIPSLNNLRPLCPCPLFLLNNLSFRVSQTNSQRQHYGGSPPVLLSSVVVRGTSLGVPFPAAGSVPWTVRGGGRGGRGRRGGEHRHRRRLCRRRKFLW